MANKAKTRAQRLSVDQLMLNVASTLVRDFQHNLQDPFFCCTYQEKLHLGKLEEIRGLDMTPSELDDSYRFKSVYQLQSLLKRYRFKHDLYTDDELILKAVEGFLDTQRRIADLDLDALPCNLQRILDHAAVYIHKVLGEYSDEQHRSLCQFGRKASVGIPARKACEAERWQLPLSGSPEQISWFDSEMSQVACVQDYWAKQIDSDPQGSIYRETSSLALVLVPKTFKAFRSIMPNTTIGSYMSYGLGEMIRIKLKRNGFDIRSLQMKHRVIAQAASVHKQYVTADLSSASDSISVALVNRLFPADWLKVLHQSRIGKVVLPDGSVIESQTFCTMGIGYTFPLQTLVFLALLIAIQAEVTPRREWKKISVYGDDLIYARDIHQDVLKFFPMLGFVINVEKTFCDSEFRESCGGDYFRGVDVRPFQPRNGTANVSPKTYEAVLYKFINGLLMRWSEHEVVATLNLLVREIEKVAGSVKLVPYDFPDDSGVKCPNPKPQGFLRFAKVARPKSLGHGVFRFAYLRLQSDIRKEERHEPYLWTTLRGGVRITSYSNPPPYLEHPSSQILEQVQEICGVKDVREPLLNWNEERPAQLVRSSLTGERLRRLYAGVVVSHTGSYKRQYGTSGFGVRR